MCAHKAERFASALEREDYDSASELLDEQVVYYIDGDCLSGKDRVLAALRRNTPRVRRVFDTVIYSHSLQLTAWREFLVTFLDAVRHRGRPFVHKCRVKIGFNAAGRIDLIIHHDMPGERDKLEKYMRAVDVEPS